MSHHKRVPCQKRIPICCQGTVAVPCCPYLIPSTLHLHFHDCTGNNSCLNGAVVPLVYNGTNWLVASWSVAGCVTFSSILLEPCVIDDAHPTGEWMIQFICSGLAIGGADHPPNTTTRCNPIKIDGYWDDGSGNNAKWTIRP